MKAISVWQPWASLLAIGAKHFETRSWATSYRGQIAIHAARKKDAECLELCLSEPFRSALIEAGMTKIGDLPFGAIVAVGTLVDCRKTEQVLREYTGMALAEEFAFGDFRPGRFAWQINHVRRMAEPVPARGQQGLWEWKP